MGRLSAFLKALPPGHQYAFEFRNPTWHTPDVYAALQHYNAAYCPFDLDGFQSSIEITADFTYVRLHGPGGKCQGSYSDAALAVWAERVRNWRKELQGVYVYFDNDQAAYAVENALRLRQLTEAVRTTGSAPAFQDKVHA